MDKSITIYIDNVPYLVDAKDNLLANVLSQKINLPYFCWHPSMGSVGACRQCAVTQYMDENDTRGRVIMSCMTPVVDGMRIGLSDESSSEFREQVISAMMTNHPHDCPVCAEGGECHLQDMTVMTGHSARDYQGSKRTFTNQYLGELVGHEMNRCITCYRCVRFYNDYAGGEDFGVYGSKNQVYFGRQSDGALESEFSGNLVEVCPTGVFTNKVFSSHYTRKWDLQSSPSICAHCSVGCNTSTGERYGSVRRVMNRYNNDINGYFLCDRGRYGLGFVNGSRRVNYVRGINQTSPQQLTTLDVQKAFSHLRGKNFIGIGSGRASLESNAYLKEVVGGNAFSAGFTEQQMAMSSVHVSMSRHFESASISQIEQSDFVLIIGEDVTQTSPRIALAVRQALRNKSFAKAEAIGIPKWQDDAVRTCGGKDLSPLYSFTSVDTKLDSVSKKVVRQTPEHLTLLVNSLVAMLSDNTESLPQSLSSVEISVLKELCADLAAAKNPLLICGWSHNSVELMLSVESLMALISKQPPNQVAAEFNTNSSPKCVLLPPQANSMGLVSIADDNSLSIEKVLEHLDTGAYEGVILLENALELLDENQSKQLRASAEKLIVLDHTQHELTEVADVLLPVTPVSESTGCYVNYQGQIQQFHSSTVPSLPSIDAWRWLTYLDGLINKQDISAQGKKYKTLTELRAFLSGTFKQFDLSTFSEDASIIARETKRVSGRTAKTANLSVHEPKTTEIEDGKFAFSMEGKRGTADSEMPFVWSPGWNSNQAVTQFQAQTGGALSQSSERMFVDLSHVGFADISHSNYCNQQSKQSDENDTARTFEVVLKTPWYQGEWQASLNPEFSLLHKENRCVVSPKLALEKVWSHGQLLKFVQGEITCFARVVIDKHRENVHHLIDENIIYLDCIESAIVGNSIATEIALASDEEEEQFIKSNKTRLANAAKEKESTLVRLQQSDQYIPIRLHAGGLNDG